MDKNSIIAEAKQLIKSHNINNIVPLDSKQWGSYLRNLRISLQFNQQKFWYMFGLSISSGSKKEGVTEDVRSISKEDMDYYIYLLDLRWESPKRYTNVDGITPTNLGVKALELLNYYDPDLHDLETLLKLHDYYQIGRTRYKK